MTEPAGNTHTATASWRLRVKWDRNVSDATLSRLTAAARRAGDVSVRRSRTRSSLIFEYRAPVGDRILSELAREGAYDPSCKMRRLLGKGTRAQTIADFREASQEAARDLKEAWHAQGGAKGVAINVAFDVAGAAAMAGAGWALTSGPLKPVGKCVIEAVGKPVGTFVVRRVLPRVADVVAEQGLRGLCGAGSPSLKKSAVDLAAHVVNDAVTISVVRQLGRGPAARLGARVTGSVAQNAFKSAAMPSGRPGVALAADVAEDVVVTSAEALLGGPLRSSAASAVDALGGGGAARFAVRRGIPKALGSTVKNTIKEAGSRPRGR
jgi:hypothetical protein